MQNKENTTFLALLRLFLHWNGLKRDLKYLLKHNLYLWEGIDVAKGGVFFSIFPSNSKRVQQQLTILLTTRERRPPQFNFFN